jgi:transposase-like protein
VNINATEEPTMTDDRLALKDLLEKTPGANYLREMIGFAAQRLMELDIESRTGAAHGKRSSERLAQRNGYRDRDWETRAGMGRTSDEFPDLREITAFSVMIRDKPPAGTS